MSKDPFELYDRLRAALPDKIRLEQFGDHYSLSPAKDPLCDFCSLTPVTYDVKAPNFEMAPGQGSRGDWAACDTCAALVLGNHWEELIDRVMALSPYGLVPREYFQELYRRLRQHMTGVVRLGGLTLILGTGILYL